MPTFVHIPPTGSIKILTAPDEDTATAEIRRALRHGYMELMPYTIHPQMAMMVDEGGRRKNLPVNERATALQNKELMRSNVILGDAVLIGRTGPDLQSCPLTYAQIVNALVLGR